MEDEKFIKEFNLKITEHVRFIAGSLEALSWVTLRNKYKHMFWIHALKWTKDDKSELLRRELDIETKNFIELDNYIGEIELKIKNLSYKYFLDGNYDRNSKYSVSAIENLVWHAVEYIEWLHEFSYSYEVEEAKLNLGIDNSGEVFCFSINKEYIVVLGITEILIDKTEQDGCT